MVYKIYQHAFSLKKVILFNFLKSSCINKVNLGIIKYIIKVKVLLNFLNTTKILKVLFKQ